ITPERRQSRAKKNTVATPLSTNAHHCQLPATPYWRTCCVTQLGVSLLNVVATIESPASHQGTERPDAKNSAVFFPASLPKKSAGKKQMTRVTATIAQSRSVRCIGDWDNTAKSLSPAPLRIAAPGQRVTQRLQTLLTGR